MTKQTLTQRVTKIEKMLEQQAAKDEAARLRQKYVGKTWGLHGKRVKVTEVEYSACNPSAPIRLVIRNEGFYGRLVLPDELHEVPRSRIMHALKTLFEG